MTQTQLDRRTLLSVGAIGIAASVLGLRAGLAHEGGDHDGTPEASPGATPDASPSASPVAAAQTHLVEMNDQLRFDPERLTIPVGDTVTWRTVGVIPHTSTADPEEAQSPEEHVQLPQGAESWNSGLVNQDEAFERTFDVAGEYTYFCIPHEAAGMIGYLTVEA